MTKILKLLKSLFSGEKKKEMINMSAIRQIESDFFFDKDLIMNINRDLLSIIVRNNYHIDMAYIMAHFKNNYDLNELKYSVLVFELGYRCARYALKPATILEDALKLNDNTFTDDEKAKIQILLKQEHDFEQERFEIEHLNYQEELEKEIKYSKTFGTKAKENLDADKAIDEWLAKNKEN